MESEKKLAMIHTYQQFMEIGLNSHDPGSLPKIIDERIFGFGTAMDEKIRGIEGIKALLEIQKKQGKGLEISWRTDPVSHYVTDDENTAVFADDVYLTIKTGEETMEMYMRFSMVLNNSNNQWKVIHWHGSKPEQVESDRDTWGLESWQQKAKELEKLVAEKTADLVEKNRELEIEAALERVRSQSMAMQDSSDLSAVVFAMFTELVKLDAQLDRCLILVVNPQTLGITWYLTGKEGLLSNNGFLIPYNDHPSHKAYLDGWRSKRKKWQYLLAGEEKKTWDAYGFSETELAQLPEFIKADMAAVEAIHLSISSDDFGCLIASSLSPLSDAHASIVERFTVVFNQTYTRFLDLQKAEAQAIRAEQDLLDIKAARQEAEEALLELKSTQAQLIHAEKMASLGELTAGIAHEIQNPLNFVNNFSEVSIEMIDELRDVDLSAEPVRNVETRHALSLPEISHTLDDIKSNLEKIHHHGKRADSIVKGMLQHSRANSGQKEPTDINALADEYLRLAYHGLRAKDKSFNASFSLQADPNLPKVKVLPQDMGRVLLNLINNAFQAVYEKSKVIPGETQGIASPHKYTPTVTVTTKFRTDHVEITIDDNGPGIPEEQQGKIFQPFFTTKPAGQGTGLGLSITYDIVVKGHSGAIEVKSEVGIGTTFVVKIPV